MARGTRPLAGLELLDGILGNPAVSHREAHDVAQSCQRTRDRVLGEVPRPQCIEQLAHVLDGDLAQQTAAERGQQVVLEVLATYLECSLAPLANSDPPREALDPPAGDLREAQLRRACDDTPTCRFDECVTRLPGDLEVMAGRAKAGLAVEHEANRVLAVRLTVDASLHSASPRIRLLVCLHSCLAFGGVRRGARSRRACVDNESMSANVELDAAIRALEVRLRGLERERDAMTRELAELRARRGKATSDTSPVAAWTPERKLALFASLFRGRKDLFPLRWEKPAKGRSGWAPCCENEWKAGVCGKPRVRCGECPNQAFRASTEHELLAHLQGRHVMGIYPLMADDTCWLLAIDLDGRSWRSDVAAICEACRQLGVLAAG